MKNPLFSVIIPSYNRAKFLKVAIESVLSQDFSDYELTIVDDGSIDETSKLLESYICDKIKYIKTTHRGVSTARNIGIKSAKGEYISFLDSDDRFRKDKLTITAQFIKKHNEYKIFHSEEIWYRNGKLLSQKKYHQKPSGFVFSNVLKLCCIGTSTAVIHRSIFEKVGFFDKNLNACEDYDFWLRVTHKFPVYLIPEYLTIKQGGHDDQQSKKYPAMDKLRIYALEKLLKSNSLDPDHYKLAFSELKNKCQIYKIGALKRNKLKEVRRIDKILAQLYINR